MNEFLKSVMQSSSDGGILMHPQNVRMVQLDAAAEAECDATAQQLAAEIREKLGDGFERFQQALFAALLNARRAGRRDARALAEGNP